MTATPIRSARTSLPARTDIENLIEVLISILDDIEPDPDLEDNGDAEAEPDNEPSLGSLDAQPQTRWNEGGGLFPSDDFELDMADDELSLGWANEGRQACLRASPGDLELDTADDEPEHRESEPLSGQTALVNGSGGLARSP